MSNSHSEDDSVQKILDDLRNLSTPSKSLRVKAQQILQAQKLPLPGDVLCVNKLAEDLINADNIEQTTTQPTGCDWLFSEVVRFMKEHKIKVNPEDFLRRADLGKPYPRHKIMQNGMLLVQEDLETEAHEVLDDNWYVHYLPHGDRSEQREVKPDVFAALKKQWLENPKCMYSSNPEDFVNTTQFARIVRCGKYIVPRIKEELSADTAFLWNLVLSQIFSDFIVPDDKSGNSLYKAWDRFLTDKGF